MPDFWRSSGFALLDRRAADGQLTVTDAFLRAYLERPEMAPVAESGPAERALHAALLAGPRTPIGGQQLSAVEDPDARENYAVWLAFRDRLLAAPTLEDAYLALFVDRARGIPSLFVDQLARVILRNLLDGTGDALRVRAAEMLFRPQIVTLHEGAVLAADAETVEMYAATGGFGDLGRLVLEAQTPLRRVELEVLSEDNAGGYWGRDERHDTALDISFARPGLDALCRVLEAWVRHLLRVEVGIQPVAEIRDERWVWHTGLDPEASAILNDLYDGREVDEERMRRLLALFRLEFRDPSVMLGSIAGRPVYLAMAMTPTNRLRLRPQNLLLNLPLQARA
jgi:Family of unknown function (DUF6352)